MEKLIAQVDELRQENKQLQDQIYQLQAEKIAHLNQLAALRAVSLQEQSPSTNNELANAKAQRSG